MPATPGIWSDEQTEGWKQVTRAVHDAGGRMLLQLWHVGRISDPMFLNGALPVAPSAVRPKGHVSLVRPEKEFVTPRALERDEIPGIIAAYRRGAENAKRAGFDGVEIHGANGYLLDQFLQDSTNQRSDAYGGPREKRARLMLEVADACVEVWGADRVGMHLAPRMDSHDMGDSDRLAHLQLCRRANWASAGWPFICARGKSRSRADLHRSQQSKHGDSAASIIANEGFDLESAEQALAEGRADAVAFGKLFIANPDLPRAIRQTRAAQCMGCQHFLFRRRQGLYRLSGAARNLPNSCRLNHASANRNHSSAWHVVILRIPEGQWRTRDETHLAKIAAAALIALGAGTVTASADPAAAIPMTPGPRWARAAAR